jgi:hypothetical protein
MNIEPFVYYRREGGRPSPPAAEIDRLRAAVDYVLTEHFLGYCYLRAATITILKQARGDTNEQAP